MNQVLSPPACCRTAETTLAVSRQSPNYQRCSQSKQRREKPQAKFIRPAEPHAQPGEERHQRPDLEKAAHLAVFDTENRQRLVRHEFQPGQQCPTSEREKTEGGKEKALARHGG